MSQDSGERQKNMSVPQSITDKVRMLFKGSAEQRQAIQQFHQQVYAELGQRFGALYQDGETNWLRRYRLVSNELIDKGWHPDVAREMVADFALYHQTDKRGADEFKIPAQPLFH